MNISIIIYIYIYSYNKNEYPDCKIYLMKVISYNAFFETMKINIKLKKRYFE